MSREYSRYLESRWGNSLKPPGWTTAEWIRIGVESFWWILLCSAVMMGIGAFLSGVLPGMAGRLWLTIALLLFVLAGFLPTHNAISVGRLVSAAVLIVAMATAW